MIACLPACVCHRLDFYPGRTKRWCLDSGVCKIKARQERKRNPCTSPSGSLEPEQGCRRAASLDEIGRLFCTPLYSSSDRIEDRTQEERGRHEEGDAWVANAYFANTSNRTSTPNFPNIIPTKIAWLKLSRKCPMDMRIPPLGIKIVPESNPPKSMMLVGRLGVWLQWTFAAWSQGRTASEGVARARAANRDREVCVYIYIYLSLSLYIYIYIYIYVWRLDVMPSSPSGSAAPVAQLLYVIIIRLGSCSSMISSPNYH